MSIYVLFCIADAIILAVLAGLNFFRGGRPVLRRMYSFAAALLAVYLLVLAGTDRSLSIEITRAFTHLSLAWPLAYCLILVLPFSLCPAHVRRTATMTALILGLASAVTLAFVRLPNSASLIPGARIPLHLNMHIAIIGLISGVLACAACILADYRTQHTTQDIVYQHFSRIVLRWSAVGLFAGGIATFLNFYWLRNPADITTMIFSLTLIGMGIRLSAYRPFDPTSRSVAEGLLLNMPDALFVLDTDGGIRRVNPAAEQLVGFPSTSIVGKKWNELARPIEYTHLIKPVELATGENRGFQAELVNADGKLIPVSCSSAQLVDLVDRMQGQVLTVRNISECIDAELQLEKSRNLRAIAHLIKGISHDFREILTVIHGSAELLTTSLNDAQTVSDAQSILAATEKAQSIIEQLAIIDDEQGDQGIVLDLTQLIQETTHAIERALDKSITFTVSLPPQPLPVHTRPGVIERIIMNLVTNAREAMPKGGELHMSLDEYRPQATNSKGEIGVDGDFAVIVIRDTGLGMSRDVLEHIFDPFFTTRADQGGTGLGLATVQTLVERMNGWVNVRSIENAGTTFEVALPLCSDTPIIAMPSKQAHITNSVKATILILDDTTPVRDLAAIMLRKLGYETLEAGNWEEGLTFLNDTSLQIDVLLVDVVMPEVSGPEFVQLAGKRRNGFGVVYMSGYTGREQEIISAELGQVQFLKKPFTRESLAEAIAVALMHKRDKDA